MNHNIRLYDLAKNYITNVKSKNMDLPYAIDQVSHLAQEDVCSLGATIEKLTFVAFYIQDLESPAIKQYESLCSSLLALTGKLPYHLLGMAQNLDVFSEYYTCYRKYLKTRLLKMGISDIL